MKQQQLNHTVLKKAAECYGITSDDLCSVSGGFQNKVFVYSKSNRNYIMRLTPKRKRTKEELHEEISWIQFLKSSGVSVSGAVKSGNHLFIEEVSDFYITVFEKAEGGLVNLQNPNQWNNDFFHRWGRLLGQVHHAGRQYKGIKGNPNRLYWSHEQPYNHELFKRLPSDLCKKKYHELMQQMMRMPVDKHHYGLIHNDFHQGNFFVNGCNITLFDFDDSAYFYYAYDIAVAFYHAYWQHTSFNTKEDEFITEFLTHFLNGYSEANKLTRNTVDHLPYFLKLRELFLYVLFLQVWDMDKLEDWQSYTIENLQKNIENNTVYAGLDDQLLQKLKQQVNKPF
ncbi:hypothetical protein AWM68_03390 [Fictibacillus phosphorivorans]|uniref:Aminoglycoside phosphotransferase domain-containing protein n=1 Tax=Fictibacillus phosphorivorans TaxID=1221500 RepID=A0A165P8C1_9BACL|nr:phosphotransferase [Fictibacillus phosphorivorans]KZE69323.1 hypothetical protein AWM68_03390 [Fictibacillus phosphorivorans]